jgi:hypothetical protein
MARMLRSRAGGGAVDMAAAVALAMDAQTVVAGAFNAAWFAARRATESRSSRRTAMDVLCVLSAGIAVQAACAQALFFARHAGWSTEPLFAPGAWIAARAPLFAGTLLLSLLILRRAR